MLTEFLDGFTIHYRESGLAMLLRKATATAVPAGLVGFGELFTLAECFEEVIHSGDGDVGVNYSDYAVTQSKKSSSCLPATG